MMKSVIKTRFAPSPTGHMHLGNARTALFNALLARHDGGGMVLRIEDTDASRDHAPHIDEIIQDLRWLGIDWAEGAGENGDNGPYRQSERAEIYAKYYAELESTGLV